jgi:hypothetical protein
MKMMMTMNLKRITKLEHRMAVNFVLVLKKKNIRVFVEDDEEDEEYEEVR